MYKISARSHFSSAHFLEDYKGLCGSIHGHRWDVVVSVTLPKSGVTAMTIDFTTLKSLLGQITDEMDHSFIIDPKGDEKSVRFYQLLKEFDMRVYEFSGRTTAENISEHIYQRVKELTGWTTHTVEVFEAPGNSVTYSE